MKKILSAIFRPWLFVLLAILALAFLIWFFGPLLSFGEDNYFLEPRGRRFGLIVFVIFVWVARTLFKKWRASKASADIVDGLVDAQEAPEADRGEEEVGVLRERFADAMEVLKKSAGRKGGASLYDLPWYIIIGPPGSGKTTALVNSGLEFPLADRFGREALSGVGGTRNCDWWFTNEAVLLDTAGRYTTQDSDADVDSTAWEGFLDLLKKNRRRRPINGVFVAISVQDLLMQSEQERAAQAATIRKRIQELYEHFGIRFPVYTLLTKADLINGFVEFFDDLGKGDREQVWGFTLPLLDKDTEFDLAAAFGEQYDALVRRLNERLMMRMRQERDLERRSRVFAFPRQVASLKDMLEKFMLGVFGSSRFEESFLWRGVYFTSGTQEGTPIDRLMGSLARTFGIDQQALPMAASQGRSYFIGDVLKKVAFTEAELAGSNRRLERQRAWLQKASYAAVVVGSIALIFGWVTSYLKNQSYVQEVATATVDLQERLAGLSPSQSHPLDLLPVLDSARQIRGGYGDRDDGAPLFQRLGLYQGRRVGRAASQTYLRLLGNQFLPRVILNHEQQMRRGWDRQDMLFEALKAYLMLDDDEHYDPVYVKVIWKILWEEEIAGSIEADEFDRLNAHAEALAPNMPGTLPVPLDEGLIRGSRREARSVSLAERAYGRIRHSTASQELTPFTVSAAAGRDASLVFRRKSGRALNDGFSGLFTYDGFHNYFDDASKDVVKDLDKDRWVLNADEDSAGANDESLADEVLALYLDDYEERYVNLLADVTILRPSGRTEAVTMLKILSHEERSPLARLVNSVLQQVDLNKQEDSVASRLSKAAGKARDVEQAVESKVRRLTGRSTPRGPRVSLSPRGRLIQDMGSDRFAKMRKMTEGEGGDSILAAVLDLMSQLYEILDDIDQSSDPDKAAKERAKELSGITADLNREARDMDPVVGEIVQTIAGSAKSIMAGSTRKYLNDQWRGEGLDICRDTIARRYPFSPNASRAIELADFGDFFGNKGLMQGFFEDYLKQYVTTSTNPWRWKGEMAGASADALRQYQRADLIRRSYFRRGSAMPTVAFALTPIEMDDSISNLVFTLGEQKITYAHGPTREKRFTWPGQDSSDVRIDLSPQTPGPAGDGESGDWGWFRLLERADMRPMANDSGSYEVTFAIGPRQATFEIDPKNSYNPFQLTELASFRCPERL